MINYLIFDILVIVCSFFLMNHKKSLTFYHPGTILLFFHFIANTFRFIAVINGANVLSPDMVGASEDELTRALFWADLALLCCAAAIYVAESKPTEIVTSGIVPVSQKILKAVVIVAIPLGLYGAATQLYIPSVKGNVQEFGAWGTSSYVSLVQPWFGLSMLALIYFKGFKKRYYIPLLVYLLIIAIQGSNRNRLVLPCIFLLNTYLYHYKLKWPTKSQLILMAGFTLLFYPLKVISKIIQEGGSLSDISTIVKETAKSVTSGNADDQVILDQYAVTLTEVDRNGKIYYGTTFAPLLVSPIPRQLWPQKPKLNQWQIDISSYYRPFDVIGSIATIYGESYANFRYLGILLVPSLLFYFLTRWYKRILSKGMYDMDKFLYTLIFCCMIQVMRDGLISLFIFPVISNMPLFIIFVLHKVLIKPKKLVVTQLAPAEAEALEA